MNTTTEVDWCERKAALAKIGYVVYEADEVPVHRFAPKRFVWSNSDDYEHHVKFRTELEALKDAWDFAFYMGLVK